MRVMCVVPGAGARACAEAKRCTCYPLGAWMHLPGVSVMGEDAQQWCSAEGIVDLGTALGLCALSLLRTRLTACGKPTRTSDSNFPCH